MTTRSDKTLRGDRNQCPGCGEHFNSTYAFEKHRVGDHGVDRRCLSPSDMEASGMVKRRDGFWVSSARETAGLPPPADTPGSPARDD